MDSTTCMELALEGERLCKSGDFNGGVAFFEAAVNVGTNDMKTLSAIYSQLGNAYFYLGNYDKAMDYHKLDLTVAKSIGDRVGEAKASGNLGNTFKMMNRFDEAIMCCTRHLEISRDTNDKVGEGRALYNLGNVYHTKGKSLAKVANEDPGEFPEDVKRCLESAVEYYKQNLDLMVQLGDKSAQGRACGNLGNTHYLLGNFKEAIAYHNERLRIAREFVDKAAERRAHCNLGNAHIFLGDFEAAVQNYKQTLLLAQELKDRVVEAQACYSLGNTYTLLGDYKSAIEYHLRHLQIAHELRDRVNEGRACWSLGNALAAVGNHKEALNYAQKHLEISQEIGDISGQTSAQLSITDLRKLLESGGQTSSTNTQSMPTCFGAQQTTQLRPKRQSMENMEIMKLTPDQKRHSLQVVDEVSTNADLVLETTAISDETPAAEGISKSHEDFLEMVSKFQSKRMDDQRCALKPLRSENKENRKPLPNRRANSVATGSGAPPPAPRMGVLANYNNNPNARNAPLHNNAREFVANASTHNNSTHSNSNHIGNAGRRSPPPSPQRPHNNFHDLFDMIAGMQERRMNDQRANLPPMRQNSATNGPQSLPGVGVQNRVQFAVANRNNNNNNHNNNHNNDFNNVAPRMRIPNNRDARPARQMSLGANVLPDDGFFEMLMRLQASRLEDQRTNMPASSGAQQSAIFSALNG